MNYRLIVIESSLKDTSILKTHTMLSQTVFEAGTPGESPMYKIEIPEKDVPAVSGFLKNNLKYPYYAHLYPDDQEKSAVIVVFAGQIFDNPKEAIAYGISHGVSREQMDIKPTRASEEKW